MKALEDKKVWEQQPGEPDNAYTAFCFYKDLPISERSVNKAYEKYLLSETDKGFKSVKTTRPGIWSQYCSANRWVDRANAYDAYKADLLSKKRLDLEVERLSNIKENTIDLVDQVTKLQLDALKDPESGKMMQEISKRAAAFQLLLGKNLGAGKFILEGFKALHGEKKEITGTLRIGPMEWK